MTSLLELAKRPVEVVDDPERLTPSDVPIQVGDASELREDTGWLPAVSMEQTLADVLDYWRDAVRGECSSRP